MKRMLLPAALLLCAAAACEPAPSTNTANTNAPANMNAANVNAANSNTMSAAAWTNDDIINGDKKAWDLIKSKDYATFESLLDDHFIDVTPAKVNNKAETVADIKTFDLTDVSLSDFKVVKLDNDAAVVTYTVSLKGSVGGKPIPANAPAERHSTAKILRGGKWLAVYHQDTPIMPPPPPPAASPASNANSANMNSAATTTASPMTTTSDVEANERAVWDALKRKDWNAFASFLADDAVEIEPDGVYDKTGSVKGVQGFPFPTTSLSDFMTTPLDDDAKIVTYTVKGTGPDKKPFSQRHSTVWVNRGGKWLAMFHQGGTPITKSAM
jgi:hypothetical protein